MFVRVWQSSLGNGDEPSTTVRAVFMLSCIVGPVSVGSGVGVVVGYGVGTGTTLGVTAGATADGALAAVAGCCWDIMYRTPSPITPAIMYLIVMFYLSISM